MAHNAHIYILDCYGNKLRKSKLIHAVKEIGLHRVNF